MASYAIVKLLTEGRNHARGPLLKAFKNKLNYDNPNELMDRDGIGIIVADKFPHTEKGVMGYALIRLEPKFEGN